MQHGIEQLTRRRKWESTFAFNMNILYESDSMFDESVTIVLQHKKRKQGALAAVKYSTTTVRGIPVQKVRDLLNETFKAELEGSDVGLYERPEEKVLVQTQHYTRDPVSKTLKYAGSKSITLSGINLQTALRRIKAAFAKPKK